LGSDRSGGTNRLKGPIVGAIGTKIRFLDGDEKRTLKKAV
jgi:hypothetical protein